jgi:MoxR-like ATPase
MDNESDQSVKAAELLTGLRSAIGQAMVGQEAVIGEVVAALAASGHVLVEGVPGLGKTLLVRALSKALSLAHGRIQFTPDMMPSDITGHAVLDPQTRELRVVRGPVFTHVLLADEINRAPAKTQSALLEVMQEYQVTLEGQTLPLPKPFMVLATQNPIETEGTYALPEAQVDRFMLKVLVGYPSATEEFVIVERMTGIVPAVQKVLTTQQLLGLQQEAARIYVDPALVEYAVRMVTATRKPKDFGLKELEPYIMFGASPRASINLILTARALAFVRGRSYVLPQDVLDMALDVIRHRLVLTYQALSDNVSSDDLLTKILDRIPIPVVPLHEHVKVRVNA